MSSLRSSELFSTFSAQMGSTNFGWLILYKISKIMWKKDEAMQENQNFHLRHMYFLFFISVLLHFVNNKKVIKMAYLYPMKLYVYAISAKIVSFSYLHPWKFIIIYANTSFACHVVHGLSNIIHRELHKIGERSLIKCTPTCRKGRGSSKVSTWKRFLNYRRHPPPSHFISARGYT